MMRLGMWVLVVGGAGCPGGEETAETDALVEVPVQEVTLRGYFTVYPESSPVTPGEACWDDGTDRVCGSLSAYGRVEIAAVAGERPGTFFVDGENAVPAAMPAVLGISDAEFGFGLDSATMRDVIYDGAAVDLDETKGTIAVQLYKGLSGVPGGQVTLEPAGSWEGPYFLGGTGTSLDLDATSTTGSGIVYFLAVDPVAGPYTIRGQTGDGAACEAPFIGTEVPLAGAYPDTITNVVVVCR